jgi:hypothetical protein
MQADVINKHLPVTATQSCPSTAVIVAALAIVVLSIAAAAVLRGRGEWQKGRKVALFGGGFGAVLVFLAATVFVSENSWTGVTAPVAPLIEPSRYAIIAALLLVSVVLAVAAALNPDEEKVWSGESMKFLAGSAAAAVVAIIVAAAVPSAGDGGYMGAKFPWGKSTLVFWVLVLVLFALSAFTKRGLCFAVPAAGVQFAAFTLLTHGAMNGLTHPQSWWFGWPVAWNFIMLALLWVTLPNGRSVAGAAFFAQLGVSFYAYMPIVSDLRNPPMNWGYPRTWEGFKHAIMRGQYEAIAFKMPTWGGIMNYLGDVMLQFTDVLVLLALVPFAVTKWVVDKAQRKTFWQWMLAAAACFLMMSVLLIGLANVKGDVQDGFIQKVKFISSHAMIAMWIGYGLVFAGVLAVRFLAAKRIPVKPLAVALAVVMVLVAGVTPVVQNYTNDRLVFEMGGAEQNGHTFGWQFGAYQLDGAKAIREQIVADEEPLPDP